jgi:DNA-binding winged helix-turn-helix (wHTH) protein
MLSRIRGKFKQVDPDFDHIESDYKHGYRWSEIHIKRQIAAFYPNFVLYDNQELIWRQVYRVHLSAKESEVMRVLMEAKGEPRRWQQLDAELGFGEDNTKKLVYLLRAKFEKTDPSAKAIHSHRNEGYRLVAPNFQPALTARQHSCRRGQLARRSPTLQRETDAAKVGKR